MLEAVVFDMDGLMIDSERLVYENWSHMMTERGYAYSLDIFKQTIGKRKKEVEQFYYGLYGSDFPYRELSERGRNRYLARIKAEGVPVKKGLYELLDYLKKSGFKIALATSTSRATSEINLQSAGVLDAFDALVCGEDVVNGKPHPEVFLTAAQRLGVEPESCIALEDSFNGIKSAHAAGMTTVMVPDFLQPAEDILPLIHCLCEDLSQVIEFIQKRNGKQ